VIVDLSEFRIAQGGLTNVPKRGGGVARVLVRYSPVAADIADDGRAGGGRGARRGHQPRADRNAGVVEVFGGELTVGPVPSGGYRVTARMPEGTASQAAKA
jgi:signal transduction histidine kinase